MRELSNDDNTVTSNHAFALVEVKQFGEIYINAHESPNHKKTTLQKPSAYLMGCTVDVLLDREVATLTL